MDETTQAVQAPECSTSSSSLPPLLPDNPQSVAPPAAVPAQANGTSPAAAQCYAGQYDGPSPAEAPPDQMGPNAGLALLRMGAGFVPGVGTVLDSADAGHDLQEHNYGSAALDVGSALFEPLSAVTGMAQFFMSDMQDHSLNPDTGLTKDQERWMYQHGAQSRPEP
jgi:hypothetical protein